MFLDKYMNEFIKYKTIVIELKKLRKNIFADSFWAFNDYLFTVDKVAIYDQAYMERILSSFNFDANKISECAKNPETIKIVAQQVRELQETGLYGTPTVFIDGRAFVGPKPYRVYRNELKRFILF